MNEFMDKLKSGFNKAKDEAEKYGKIAIKKSSNVVSQTKLSLNINELEGKIKDIKAQIGEILFNEFKNGKALDGELLEKCTQIEHFMIDIEELKSQIADLKDSVICPNCGEFNSDSNSFCAKCGEKLEKHEEPASNVEEEDVEVTPADTE